MVLVPLRALLALPTLLIATVVAIPSPAPSAQQPLISTAGKRLPLWKSLSHKLVETIWGINDGKPLDAFKTSRYGYDGQAPPHTLARYGADVVVRFNISTTEEAESLAEAADTLMLDVWEFSQDWVDIRLAKDIVPSLLGLLPASLQHKHTPLLTGRDLAQALYDTYSTPNGQPLPQTATAVLPYRNTLESQRHHNDEDSNLFFTNYQPLSVVHPWQRLLASLFPTHVRFVTIGQSYEGRQITALRVGVHPTNSEDPDPPKRKTVLITGGVHAREWISISTVNYIAYSLITSYGKNPTITKLLEDLDFVFIPTVNPDGYAYTWTTDRLWRKNRQNTTLRFCPGMDLDRAYNFSWDSVSTAGNPCSENFAGDAPFAAVEAKAIAEWARNETENNNVEFVSFVDLHSYSQQILYPWSYSCSDTPPGQENLEELALGLGKAIRMQSGYFYEVLPACEGNVAISQRDGGRLLLPRIEAQGGSALDWFYGEMRVRYAYQIKLRDRGAYGFLLPKGMIVPTGREILAAMLHLGGFLQEVFVKEKADGDLHVDEVMAEGDLPGDIAVDDEGDDWIMVEDLLEEEMMAEPQMDLRRRRKR